MYEAPQIFIPRCTESFPLDSSWHESLGESRSGSAAARLNKRPCYDTHSGDVTGAGPHPQDLLLFPFPSSTGFIPQTHMDAIIELTVNISGFHSSQVQSGRSFKRRPVTEAAACFSSTCKKKTLSGSHVWSFGVNRKPHCLLSDSCLSHDLNFLGGFGCLTPFIGV